MSVTATYNEIINCCLTKAIDATCKISLSDRMVIEMARTVMMRNKPRSTRHLTHYLLGSGAPIKIDTWCLFEEDPGVLSMFLGKVHEQLSEGLFKGEISIPQWSYTNSDWLYALGGIKLDWKQEDEFISISFMKRYRWHPQEIRITQRVHQAAENLKKTGAEEFTVVGVTTRIPINEIINFKGKKTSPPKRFYLL